RARPAAGQTPQRLDHHPRRQPRAGRDHAGRVARAGGRRLDARRPAPHRRVRHHRHRDRTVREGQPMKIRTLLTVAALAAAPALAQDTPAAQDGSQRYNPEYKVEIAWNRYYDYEQIVGLLEQMQAAHPDLVTLESLGKSLQG